ncbi:MAG: hypothetical protein IKR66_03530 [Bacteroidales bacterium]|nr:hypothetical protein [Bacteroidales bacterium]
MKRNLIYGLLICLFALCSQVGVGQTYTVRATYAESTIRGTSVSCGGKFKIPIDGDNVFHNGFCIYKDGIVYRDVYNSFELINLTKPINNGSTYGLREPASSSTVHGWLLLDEDKKELTYLSIEPPCGPSLSSASITATNYCAGSVTANLNAVYSFSPALTNEVVTFQWYKDGEEITGEIASSITIDVDYNSEYTYEVFLDGASKGTSTQSFTFSEPNPRIEVDASALSVVKKVGQVEPATITLTPRLLDVCPGVDEGFTVSVDNPAFSIESDDEGYTLTFDVLNSLSIGTYNANVTFINGDYKETLEIAGSLVDYPKTYTLKRCKVGTCNNFNNYNEWEDFEITTDSDGNLSLTMPSDNGYLYVNTSEIICNTFNLNSSASDHGESRFLNVGKLQASESLNIGSSSNRVGGDSPFVTECSSVMIAPTINLYTKQSTDSLKGVFRSESFNLNHQQGGSIEVKECTFIKSTEATIYISGGSMEFNMKGHLISDEITINNPTTYVNMDGIMTVGSVTGGTKIIVGKKATVNLCVNPSQGGDNMGMIAGNVLYNYGDFDAERGWGASNPKDEVDINDPVYLNNNMWRIPGCTADDINNVNLIKAYASYDDCIAEKNMASFLPIELVSFNFQKANNSFVWRTASETNNDYFVVEYSKNGKDWVECSGHVPAVSTKGYSYSVNPNMSINNSLFSYFRLKQVDNNGEYSYSNVITVSFSVDNPCSEEYESNKVQIREMGGKWFRVITGELIYCENDN